MFVEDSQEFANTISGSRPATPFPGYRPRSRSTRLSNDSKSTHSELEVVVVASALDYM